MKIFQIINKKIITTFALSMITILSVSVFLNNVEKEDLQKAVASINLINNTEEEKEDEELLVIDFVDNVGKEDNINRLVSFEGLSVEEAMHALQVGSLKMEYSSLYTTSPSRLTQGKGAIFFNGHKETYYSQNVLPGYSLRIPGRHVADDGTIRDENGFICVAANTSYMSWGDIVITSLGPGKVYDSGCAVGVIDIYVNW